MITKENCPNLKCNCCKFYPTYKEPHSCKRIKNFSILQFAHSPFISDTLYNPNGICSDFIPGDNNKWLKKHWTTFDDYFKVATEIFNESWVNPPTNRTVGIKIVGQPNVIYEVKYEDFVYGTMFDGNILKAVQKVTQKRTRTGFGYKLIREDINGVDYMAVYNKYKKSGDNNG
jgi:hypothetical protein